MYRDCFSTWALLHLKSSSQAQVAVDTLVEGGTSTDPNWKEELVACFHSERFPGSEAVLEAFHRRAQFDTSEPHLHTLLAEGVP